MMHLHEIFYYFDIRLFFLLFTISWFLFNFYSESNLPPGPWGLPIVGYLPFLHEKSEKQLANLCDKYRSSIISLRLGSQLVIVLGNYESIKEAFIKQGSIFIGRPLDYPFKLIKDYIDISSDEGESWNEQRRFMLSVFRDKGVGKTSLEPKILEEITYYLKAVQEFEGEAMDPNNILGVSVANIIAAVAYGNRFNYSDQKFQHLRTLIDESFKLLGSTGGLMFFPILKRMPYIRKILQTDEFINTRGKVLAFNKVVSEEHKKVYVDQSKKDYLDAYITRHYENVEQKGNEGHFNWKYLAGNLTTLFAAGTDTTRATLRWSFLYMMANPAIQEKVFNEIEEIVGNSRYPTTNDRILMPYTEATLMEIQRCSSVVPLNLVHCNTEETTIFGFRIPKRSHIISNLWAVHHDPDLWDDVDAFMPERFLNQNGTIKKCEYLIPFSVGKRSCVGESLARMELFLYFTATIQRFKLKPEHENAISFDYVGGILRSPKPFKMLAIQRENYDVLHM